VDVRAALIDAHSAGDQRRLAELCRVHRDAIGRDFVGWTRVPEQVRADPAQVQRYGDALIGVARFFATELGEPALLDTLRGPPEADPVAAWQRTLGQAQQLMGELRFGEARQVLTSALGQARGLTGPAADRLLSVTYGKLGECCFQLGEVAAALEPTTTALRLCEQQRDLEGVLAYLGNLVEIHRYLGQAGPAAAAAERYADALTAAGQAGPAATWRGRARLVRAGEPLNRVVVVVDGEQYELDDLPAVGELRAGFVFQRNRITLAPARRRIADGEQLGGQGRHAEAYASLQEAARLDPFDPHPRYLSGLALLHLRRPAEAVAEYEATERLAPGWFNCRADLWLARELARGALDHELFRILYYLEDAPAPPEEKARAAEAALRRAPRLAPLHLFHGRSLDALGATAAAAAAAAYSNGLACATEPDVRSRLLVALSVVSPSAPQRVALLTEAAAIPGGNLIAAAMATVALRAARATRP
jgi:tetratricopeptide (TPR) repeat protein